MTTLEKEFPSVSVFVDLGGDEVSTLLLVECALSMTSRSLGRISRFVQICTLYGEFKGSTVDRRWDSKAVQHL